MPSIRSVISEYDLGGAGWRTLHELARRRGRSPAMQVVALVRYALDRALAGDDVELSQSRLDNLLAPGQSALDGLLAPSEPLG